MRLWAADDLWMQFWLTLIHLLDVLDEDGALESPPSLRWFCSVPLMTLGCLLLFSLEGAMTFVRRENQDWPWFVPAACYFDEIFSLSRGRDRRSLGNERGSRFRVLVTCPLVAVVNAFFVFLLAALNICFTQLRLVSILFFFQVGSPSDADMWKITSRACRSENDIMDR